LFFVVRHVFLSGGESDDTKGHQRRIISQSQKNRPQTRWSCIPFTAAKWQTVPRAVIRDYKDFAVWYTPGVAAPCKAIQADRDKAYEYTSKWNTVAVVSDGTRVLGLGNIGPEAAMPVMEGKAMLLQIPRRCGCGGGLPGYQRPGGNHPHRQDHPAVVRRYQPGRYRKIRNVSISWITLRKECRHPGLA